MQHAVLLGRDSWMRFNTRSYRSFPPRPLDQRAFGELTLSHHAPTGASSFVSDLLTSGGGFHLRYDGADCVTLSDEPQLLTVNPLPRLITLENRKGSTNGNAGFLSRLPQPATEHDHSGASRFTPVDDEATYLFRACGLLTSSTSVPGMGLGGLVPQPDSAVLGGLPLTATAFCDFPAHGPRMRVDDLSAPTGRFAARVSAFVGTGDDRLGRAPFWPATDATSTPVFAVPSGVTPPKLSPRAPTPPSEKSVALPPTGRISAPKNRRCGRCRAACC